jgi:hypothetical protein
VSSKSSTMIIARHSSGVPGASLHTSQSWLSGGTGRPPLSPACSARMRGQGFRMERGNARLLVNSKPVIVPPACNARSMIGRKSFTFSVSNHLFSAADQATGRRRSLTAGQLVRPPRRRRALARAVRPLSQARTSRRSPVPQPSGYSRDELLLNPPCRLSAGRHIVRICISASISSWL